MFREASAERGGGGWGRGLSRSQARRSAPPCSAPQEKRPGLRRQRPWPQIRSTPKTVQGLGYALERFPGGWRQAGVCSRRRRGSQLHSAQASNRGPCLSCRFPLGVSVAASGAVYTVGPRTPPPPPLPPSLHPSAVADSAAATSSAAASSLWSIFQPPNPEKQRLQPRRQETPPQQLGGPGGQSTGGFSAIEQQPLSLLLQPPPRTPSFPRPLASPAPSSHPLGSRAASCCTRFVEQAVNQRPTSHSSFPCTSVLSFPRP
ncbi:uncharacterized protein LOC120621530 [Pteropus medius]|uniref:uncharacterized protein LOC120621530 n=1 Tax=Pteropus vampyrus TaxID=132908 RepID=UPI00196B5ABE|nr:uncharacterized protein LOC120621530 [Pteropus giganteus]